MKMWVGVLDPFFAHFPSHTPPPQSFAKQLNISWGGGGLTPPPRTPPPS